MAVRSVYWQLQHPSNTLASKPSGLQILAGAIAAAYRSKALMA
ncbi:hypothetical protein [Nodosilinea sp. LEGE 07088]|nr:hypothetical protein [Nodosilinea sp. LEGE 07088]